MCLSWAAINPRTLFAPLAWLEHTPKFFHRLEGPTAFINNSAYVAAGIYNHGQRDDSSGSGFEEGNGGEYKPATIIFPDDTIFEDNDADVSLIVVVS